MYTVDRKILNKGVAIMGCGCSGGGKKEIKHSPNCKCTPQHHCGCFDGKPCKCN